MDPRFKATFADNFRLKDPQNSFKSGPPRGHLKAGAELMSNDLRDRPVLSPCGRRVFLDVLTEPRPVGFWKHLNPARTTLS